MSDKKINIYKRHSAFADLSEFDPGFANEHDFIEVTEWHNGEGFDVEISKTSKLGIVNDRRLQFTYGEFDAIRKLVKIINKEKETEYEKRKEKRDDRLD